MSNIKPKLYSIFSENKNIIILLLNLNERHMIHHINFIIKFYSIFSENKNLIILLLNLNERHMIHHITFIIKFINIL